MNRGRKVFTIGLLLGMAGATCLSTGSAAVSVPYDLDDPAEPWRTSRSGISTRVMPPYTPLVQKGETVACWGRAYTFGDCFPTAVVSQGQSLLAQPIALLLKQDGKWSVVEGGKPEFREVRQDRIDFLSAAAVGPVEISARSWIEYDGLVRTDLTLDGKPGMDLEGLRLRLAFDPQASILYHTEIRWGPLIYRRSPPEPGTTVTLPWQPLVWVGNHDVGFTIVTETWDGWTSDQDAIRFERHSQHLELTLEIITQPPEWKGPRTYRFGFLATPMKPMRPDRWDLRIGALPGANLTTTMHGGWAQPRFSFPQPGDFDQMAQAIAKSHTQGIRHLYYITTSATSIESAVNQRHHADWVMSQVLFEGGEWKVGAGLIGADACCPGSSFADFMAWGVEQLLTHLDFDGLYIDNPGPYGCQNTRHGCGAGGKKTFPFFALHDLHKRLYTIVKTHKPEGFIWEHTSETFNPLQLAWVDVYSDGEQFRDAKRFPKEKLDQVFDRAYMEITGTGHQVGAVPCFLSSMGHWRGDWAHWLLSRTLPWGQMMTAYHGWIDATPAMAASQARRAFGLGQEPVVFYRPHELPPWFSVSSQPDLGEELVVCLWERERDQALLAVLANWSDEAVVARIASPQIRAHLGSMEATDAWTGIPFPRELLLISIPADSVRMVTLERREE